MFLVLIKEKKIEKEDERSIHFYFQIISVPCYGHPPFRILIPFSLFRPLTTNTLHVDDVDDDIRHTE